MIRHCNWPFTSRGFFSEILVFLYFKQVLRLLYSTSLTPAFSHSNFCFWTPFLNLSTYKILPCPGILLSPIRSTPFERRIHYITQFLPFQRLLLGVNVNSVFNRFWNQESEREILALFPSFYELLAEDLDAFFPSAALSNSFHSISSSISLPISYHALHVRRGDKILLNEASSMSIYAFIDRLRDFEILSCDRPLLIISDDALFATKLASILLHCFNVASIVNPLSQTIQGHSQLDFLRLPVTLRHRSLQDFLFEFLLLSKANKLVVSLSSNVGKALYLHRRGHHTYSVDNCFSIC